MSEKIDTITVKPDRLTSPSNNKETFQTGAFHCPYCGGLGFIPDHFNRDADGKICGLCNGTKKIAAQVVIEWLPALNK